LRLPAVNEQSTSWTTFHPTKRLGKNCSFAMYFLAGEYATLLIFSFVNASVHTCFFSEVLILGDLLESDLLMIC